MPREELVRRSRILVVDDEEPPIIEDLRLARFSVDYLPDIDASTLDRIERRLYDLVLLDFGNVGHAFGRDEGLSLLRHIKRVNPAIVVVAYTSRGLGSAHADFYRLADLVLSKDAGIQESAEKIEDGLRKAHSVENLWAALLAIGDIAPGSKQDREWQDLLVRGLSDERKLARLKQNLAATLQSETAKELGLSLLGKLIEVGVRAVAGV